jgi:hypothetical protein
LFPTNTTVFNIKRRSSLILLLVLLRIYNIKIRVALLYTLVINIKAFKLNKGGINKAVEKAINNILKRVK